METWDISIFLGCRWFVLISLMSLVTDYHLTRSKKRCNQSSHWSSSTELDLHCQVSGVFFFTKNGNVRDFYLLAVPVQVQVLFHWYLRSRTNTKVRILRGLDMGQLPWHVFLETENGNRHFYLLWLQVVWTCHITYQPTRPQSTWKGYSELLMMGVLYGSKNLKLKLKIEIFLSSLIAGTLCFSHWCVRARINQATWHRKVLLRSCNDGALGGIWVNCLRMLFHRNVRHIRISSLIASGLCDMGDWMGHLSWHALFYS